MIKAKSQTNAADYSSENRQNTEYHRNKNQPSRKRADGHIAFAMSCNGLLQRPAIMQAAHAVPEGPGSDEPPVA